MDKETLNRLENNHYAIGNAIERLSRAIEFNYEQDIYTSLGETLLWVLVTDEWHIAHNPGYIDRRNVHNDGMILLGLRHAYNMVKHNMNIMQVHQHEGGFSFPLEFPLEILPISVHWMKAGIKLEGKYKKQKMHYEEHIEGKEVVGTFEDSLEFLREEYQRIITKP